ncbi:asparagine synthase-related protein [Pseudonocardia alaniniphila]|uniref:asparagine synthase (glutamine-hydrolyzing) n=1 Tax=Pseudonocardia alaniniphila TaxID=75291 RepID=A0ABS9TT59_9PSEU|nr:asparagine synthase-related protein [Pseudonocardia alaniniphila]MCH6171750.1 asparagine synthase-related protein [Pseudonocardia alaniniphila]
MFADVHVLPPAATAVVTANSGGMTIQERRKWDAQPVPTGLEAAAELVRETLRVETERLSIADVPVAAVTSGGLDSSFVTALLASKLPGLVGFHVRYQGHWPFDEVVFARDLANQYKLRLHEVELDSADFPDMLDDVVRHLGQPNADPITVSTFALFRAVHAAGYRVALTGDGADEFFGGYDRVKAALLDGEDWADRYVAALAAAPARLRWQLYSADYQDYLRAHGTTQNVFEKIN